MGYLNDNCLFDRLTSEIINQCQSYKCSNDSDIDSFFHIGNKDNFEDFASELMSNSHCFFTDEDNPKMVCAFALASSALRTDVLPKSRRNRFNRDRKIPNTKRRSQYPAILITQLCIFDGFGNSVFGHDIGKEMMDLIKTMAIDPDNDNAARYLVVDAINNPKVIDYYKRNGFELLFTSDEEEMACLRGYKNANPILRWLGDFFHVYKKDNSSECKTRLMFFDLILLNADQDSPIADNP